ncbi:MAG: MFS transporter [Acidobacteriota bacterium]
MADSQDTPSSSAASETAVSGGSWALLSFLTLLNVMNFVDRQLLASFANFIVPDLGLTNTQFGLLTGLVFIVFYAAMGLFMGALADMFHRPRLIAAALTLWSALTAASGAARGFASLALPRMFIGVGESALTPTSLSILSDRFPSSKLGLASGIYYMGVPIGVGASLLVAGYMGPAIGWRNCFYLLGAVGLVLAVIMLFVKETPRRAPVQAAATTEKPKVGEIIRSLFSTLGKSPALLLTIAGGVTLHFILGAAAFDQLWYVAELGFDKAEIAQKTGWIGMIGGILGNLFGGWGGDWFQRKTGQGRPMFLFWIGLAAAPFGIAYRLSTGDSVWFWVGVFLGFFQLGTFYGPTFATVQELSPPTIRATVVAFYILMLNLIGLGIGITAGGYMADRLTEAGHATPYGTTLLVFTIISMAATPLFFFAGRRFEKDRDRLYAELGG